MRDDRTGLSDDERLARAEMATGHVFADRDLLRRALTHPSYPEGSTAEPGYERLEFLGDAVLSLVVAEELYHRFPDLREGSLSKLRVGAVAGSTLAQAARELGLADALFRGAGERAEGERGMASALEDAFEALVAALYLDAGFDTARGFVSRALGAHIGEHAAVAEHPKSDLQELLQAQGKVPHYRLIAEEGPPHDRTFTVTVELDGEELGRGVGRSKKEAEKHAAGRALERLGG